MFHVAASLSMKTGRRTAVRHGVRRGGERERRDEHVVAGLHTDLEQREVQRRGAAGERDRTRPAGQRANLGLERVEVRARPGRSTARRMLAAGTRAPAGRRRER